MNVLFYGCALSNLDNAAAQQLCKTTNPMEKSLFIPVVNKCILSTYTLHTCIASYTSTYCTFL